MQITDKSLEYCARNHNPQLQSHKNISHASRDKYVPAGQTQLKQLHNINPFSARVVNIHANSETDHSLIKTVRKR